MIDAHIHVGAWDHPDFLGRRCTLEEALAELDGAGIGGAAVVPTDQCKNAELLAEARQALAGGYGGKLWLFPWVRPADTAEGPADLAWLDENAPAVCGLKIHPSLSRQRVDGDGFRPALELAERRGLVVLVHCGRWQEMASYRFAIEAAARHPRARFLLAHAGGDTPPLATAAAELLAERKLDNVWFEFSGLREYWVVERNVARLGAGRYLMGSDYCLAHPLMYVGAVRGMKLSERDRERILGENALELFGPALRTRA